MAKLKVKSKDKENKKKKKKKLRLDILIQISTIHIQKFKTLASLILSYELFPKALQGERWQMKYAPLLPGPPPHPAPTPKPAPSTSLNLEA